MNAVKLHLLLSEKETDESKKETIGDKTTTIMNKAEALKKEHLEPIDNINEKNMTVHYKLDKVRCVKITTTSEPELLVEDSLQLFSIEGQYYINIGNNFAYELTQAMPCLAASTGYYILPGTDDTFYGIIFPEGIPSIYCQRWEQKLSQICLLKLSNLSLPVDPSPTIEDPDESNKQLIIHLGATPAATTIVPLQPSSTTTFNPINHENINSLSQTVGTGSQYISHGILTGADLISKKIESASEKIKEMIDPSETPVQVPANIKTTLNMAKKVTPLLVDLSGMLVRSVQTVVKGVGGFAADHIKTNLIASGNKIDTEDPTVAAAKHLGRNTAKAIITIWNSLEDAGMVLLASTGKATVNVVQHKFGEEVATVTADGFSVAKDVMESSNKLKGLGVKLVVKGVAKESVRNVMGWEDKNAPPITYPVTAPPTITYPDTPATITYPTTPADTTASKK